MKATLENTSALSRKLNIQVPAPSVDSTFENTFKEIQRKANIKGFRPGKAPITTIKSLYSSQVVQDVAQDLVQKHYWQAVKEHSLNPISYPDFEFDPPAQGQEFSFTAVFEVRPEVKLKQFEGLSIEKEKFVLEDARVQTILDNIRGSRAELVTVLEDRPAQKGDVAIIDFKGMIAGAPLENGSAEDFSLELGSSQFIEGFEAGVIGMKVSQNKKLKLKFPDEYQAADIAGKEVEFDVTLKSLKKKDLPELTDSFVKTMMGGEGDHSVASLKKTIIEDIEKTENKRIDGDLKNRVLKKLVELNPVEVPPTMLKEQKQMLVQDAHKRFVEEAQKSGQVGMTDEQFNQYAIKWDKDFEMTAKQMIQSGFIVDAIATQKNLTWTEEDMDKKLVEYAGQTGLGLDRLKEFYSRPEQQNRLTYMITEEKVIDYVVANSKVKEVLASELKEKQN
jgi:trigger factor